MMTRSRKETMRRTKANLDFIDEYKKDHKNEEVPFEVTQLVNSFLMTVLQNWDDLESTWSQMPQDDIDWPDIETSKPNQQPQHCVEDIRNALAHGCFVFEEDQNGVIDAIHLWTCPPRCTKVKWHATINLEDMRQMLKCFIVVASCHDLQPRVAKIKGQPC